MGELEKAAARVPTAFLVLPNFHSCFYNSVETRYMFSISVYEVKNNCCLFEGLFKVKKNGIFLFGISLLIVEIFTFLYYANEESGDVIGGST